MIKDLLPLVIVLKILLKDSKSDLTQDEYEAILEKLTAAEEMIHTIIQRIIEEEKNGQTR